MGWNQAIRGGNVKEVLVGVLGVLACGFVVFFGLEWRAMSRRGIGAIRGDESDTEREPHSV